jgi:alpha-beta hydrolase superfamily lysophospholipase
MTSVTLKGLLSFFGIVAILLSLAQGAFPMPPTPSFNPILDNYSPPSRIFEFLPPTPAGALVFIHGYRASMSRYPSLIQTLLEFATLNNVGLIGLELPGHSRNQDIHLPESAPDASQWIQGSNTPADTQPSTQSNPSSTTANNVAANHTDPLTHHIDSFETYSRSVHQALQRTNLYQAPIYFVGHSMGAAVILQYVVLIGQQQDDQNQNNLQRTSDPLSNNHQPIPYPSGMLLINPLIRIPFSGPVQFGIHLLSPIIHRLPNGIPMSWLRAYGRYSRTIQKNLSLSPLNQIPTHMILGQRDRVIQNGPARRLTQQFPTVTSTLLPGVDHWEVEQFDPESSIGPAIWEALTNLMRLVNQPEN